MTLHVRTRPLDDARPLLGLLGLLPDDARTVFVREGDGIVTSGVAATLPVPSGAGRLATARAALDALAADADVDDQVGLPGTGLVAVGSFTFDGAGGVPDAAKDTAHDTAAGPAPGTNGSVLRIPRLLVGRRGDATWMTTVTTVSDAGDADAAGAADPDAAMLELHGLLGGAARPHDAALAPDLPERDRPRYAGSTLDDASWLEAVERTVAAIRAGRAEKAVLARDVQLWSRAPFPTDEVLAGLAQRFPSCFTFLVDGLVGASPELLLRRERDRIASRVLAGTAPRGADAAQDAQLGAELMASRKDRWEHDLAARSVTEVLGPVCTQLDAPEEPSLVRLDNVQHLGSDVTGTLAAPVHILDLLDALHPTAAVAGTPREAALTLIREAEGMDRGRYAGPVGWCDADGDGEFAIALRCAEIDGTRARLFAGAGIVDGSLPEAELMETWLKLRAMTDVLRRD